MHKLNDEQLIKVSRGNPYRILEMCSQILENKEIKPLKYKEKNENNEDIDIDLTKDIIPIIDQ